MLTQDNYVKGKLVEMGWRFGQSYVGAAGHIAGQMIMHTLANRVRCGWGSWLQVVDRVPSFMAENEMPPLTHPSLWDAAFVKLLQTVDGIFDGSVPDSSKGALYWGDLAKIERPWFMEKIVQAKRSALISQDTGELAEVPAHQRVANLNGLCFFA